MRQLAMQVFVEHQRILRLLRSCRPGCATVSAKKLAPVGGVVGVAHFAARDTAKIWIFSTNVQASVV